MSAALTQPTLTFTSFQAQVMATPEVFDLFLGGGRGGGKSYAIAMLMLRHGEQYGSAARMLFVRKSFPGIVDFEQTTREVFGLAYGGRASYNAGSPALLSSGAAAHAASLHSGCEPGRPRSRLDCPATRLRRVTLDAVPGGQDRPPVHQLPQPVYRQPAP